MACLLIGTNPRRSHPQYPPPLLTEKASILTNTYKWHALTQKLNLISGVDLSLIQGNVMVAIMWLYVLRNGCGNWMKDNVTSVVRNFPHFSRYLIRRILLTLFLGKIFVKLEKIRLRTLRPVESMDSLPQRPCAYNHKSDLSPRNAASRSKMQHLAEKIPTVNL